MNFKYLCQQYGLGRFQTAAPLTSGTVSQVWRLDTDDGTFLVRTLTGKAQGQLEWSIHRHLRERRFTATPAILVPYFEQDGGWYQVQEHLSGIMPNPSAPGTAAAMGRTVRALTDALSDFPGGPVIHGDLGPWNMVEREGALSVIDFGAARPGHPLFDAAAALGGVINHSPEGERLRACREFLTALGGDTACLPEQLRLWTEEGAARWKGTPMEAKFYNTLNWAEEHWNELQTHTHDR